MQKTYEGYKDIADFYLVYIKEAHAADSNWPVGYAKELGIKQHINFGERCQVAERLFADKELTMPCLVDGMNDEANKAYHAYPDRIFVIRKDGKLAVAAKRGPFGFKPALDATGEWLAQFRRTGTEPPLVASAETKAGQ
jgi:hypothetical protein